MGVDPAHDTEWSFFLELAASCLCDEPNLASFLENSKLDDLGDIPVDGGEYGAIERLLVASESW
jgi:hypothetical protein